VADEEDLIAIAERVLLTPGNIHRAAPMAMAVAALDGRDRARPADVRTATATLSREALETLAAHLPPLTGDVPPVLSPAATDEVGTLLSLCRQRERLVAFAGAAVQGTGSRGVRALFSGPSGTGKTLAARYVASRLGLELYRVDLSAVVSKYIGETEQNLDQVLGRAEELDVVLLLDEGDALMTGRTEVGNANDRYANLETNFLLQRLETFDGIVIITSNAANRIDSAFQRRIDVTVDLTPPDPDARRQIWLSHLPGDHTVSTSLLEEVARRCALTGGRIRNAALHACLLSLERGRPVDDDALLSAVRREYRRMGATFPLAATVVG
jgi:SpoVK/Ycf46/Vps4 family AAA+-type ATPase